jgi:hypothetical protein
MHDVMHASSDNLGDRFTIELSGRTGARGVFMRPCPTFANPPAEAALGGLLALRDKRVNLKNNFSEESPLILRATFDLGLLGMRFEANIRGVK